MAALASGVARALEDLSPEGRCSRGAALSQPVPGGRRPPGPNQQERDRGLRANDRNDKKKWYTFSEPQPAL